MKKKKKGFVDHVKRFVEIFRTEGVGMALTRAMEFQLTKLSPYINLSQYKRWSSKHEPGEKELALQRLQGNLLPQKPLISLVVPVYNPPLDILADTLASVINQTYANWECCIANGDGTNSAITNLIDSYAKKDDRFKVVHLEENLGIAGNTNAAVGLASGTYVAFLDHDDLIAPFALFEVARRLVSDPHIDVFYSDEDNINLKGVRSGPFFKPDFSPDLLRSVNYMCHFLVVRKTLGDAVGWIRAGYEGAQDFDFILRITEKAGKIEHIPMMLYHWRSIKGSTAFDSNAKPYAGPSGIRALEEHLQRRGTPGSVETVFMPTWYRVRYDLTRHPLVTIIILNHDHADDLRKLVTSILGKSTYKNYELLIVENNSMQDATFKLYEELQAADNRVRVAKWDHPFNYSQVNNWAAQQASGSVLLFLNNDIEVITPAWLEEMLMLAQRQEVGTVGAKLYFPNDTIQHAGVILGIGDVAGHGHKGFHKDLTGHGGQLLQIRNTAANTAACVMMRKEVFEQVGGFDENYILAYGDVDLCLKVLAAGYVNVWTPFAELYHHESKTRGYERSPEQLARYQNEVFYFRQRWDTFMHEGDPYYNPNLSSKREDFHLA